MSQQNADSRYNGFTNKYTWLVSLWLDNDYGLYQLVNEWSGDCDDVDELAERVQVFVVDESNPLTDQASLYSDLLSTALAKVRFEEVVKGYWNECKADDDEDES